MTHLNADWQRAVENVRQATIDLLARPSQPHAVGHDAAHADRVVVLLDGLTETLMTRPEHKLAQEEIYILLAAAHLHAVGMQNEQSEPNLFKRLSGYPTLSAEMIYGFRIVVSPISFASALRP